MKRIVLCLLTAFGLAVALMMPAFAQEVQTPSIVSFKQPVLITSIGQSAGAMMAMVLAQKAGLSSLVYKQRASLKDLDAAKTLIVVLGASGKGLGAAGVDIDTEIAWGKKLFAHAKELKIPIIAMQIEGEVRRGPMSDRIINALAPQSDYLIVKESANKDGLFTKISTKNKLPITFVKITLDVVPIFQKIFKISPTKEKGDVNHG